MKSIRLFSAIGNIDDRFIDEDAEDISVILIKDTKTSYFSPRLKLAIPIAACLCLVAFGAYALIRPLVTDISGRPVLQWSERFSAADYFKYNDAADEGMSSQLSADYASPYSESRSFSDNRKNYETSGIIPVMHNHPLFYCGINYNDDGSIYSLGFSWHRRNQQGGINDDYSDLSITAGYQEIEKITDCIIIELDDKGNIVKPAVTVTERDGIQIVAEGNENRKKTLTFQNESGWYQIQGSWNDSYTSMAILLDWIWEHPIDFRLFPMEAGDNFTTTTIKQMPDAFNGYIPDFAAYGFIEESDYISLKNGIPYAFEGHFIAHAPEELVKESNYYEVEGWTSIHWCIFTDPEPYVIAKSLGELNELTEQTIFSQFDPSGNQSSIAFVWNKLFIQVYSNTPHELWTILEMLINSYN